MWKIKMSQTTLCWWSKEANDRKSNTMFCRFANLEKKYNRIYSTISISSTPACLPRTLFFTSSIAIINYIKYIIHGPQS